MIAHHERIITIKIFASEAPINPEFGPKPAKIHGNTTRVETLTQHKRRNCHDFAPTC